MPRSVVLNAYSVYFRESRIQEAKTYRLGSKFDYDAADHIHAFLLDLSNRVVDSAITEESGDGARQTKKRMWLEEFRRDSHGFYGIVECGDVGQESCVRGPSGDKRHLVKTDEGNLPPYYFRFLVPDDGSVAAVLITQRSGSHGIKSILVEEMRSYFTDKKNTTIVVKHVSDEAAFDQYHDSRLHEIKAIYKQTNASARSFFQKTSIGGTKVPKDAEVIVSIKLKSDGKQKWRDWKKLIEQQHAVDNIVEIDGFDHAQDVAFVVKVGHRTRTFRASKHHQAPIGLDVTDNVCQKNGNPILESIDKQGLEYAMEVKAKLDRGN